ncbi:hypothetical protein HAX54_022603 [Datura stramonium]|uniref:Histidine-containing phosphotransfer protein n=1 Tax=Datura stramonium TaxID=4076 RepID=A0ABS8S4B5_DATST|nr:hypothetical protein [Datura stramonium]
MAANSSRLVISLDIAKSWSNCKGKLASTLLPCTIEKILDEQFIQLQQLQDEAIQTLWWKLYPFSSDSENFLMKLQSPLQEAGCCVHQLKGSSSSIGAQRVQRLCISFRNYCDERNVEGCLKCLQQVKNEYTLVKSKLETLFKLEKQFADAGGSFPVV